MFDDRSFRYTPLLDQSRYDVRGTLVALPHGTLATGLYSRFNWASMGLIVAFFFVLGLFLFGLPWLMLIQVTFVKWYARGTAIDELVHALDGVAGEEAWTGADQHASDPTVTGAAAGAPPSLQAVVAFDQVVFSLASSTVRVSNGGVKVRGRTVSWEALERVKHEGEFVQLLTREGADIEVMARSAPAAAWLVRFIEQRDANWGGTREAWQAAVDELSALRQQ